MTSYLTKLLFRLVLPLSLIAVAIVRFNTLSGSYLLCLLVVPLISSPGHTKSNSALVLECVTLALSTLFILAHVVFQIVLILYKPYGHFVKPCTTAGDIASQFGFYRFDGVKVIDAIRLLAPDVVIFATSLVTLLFTRNTHAAIDDQFDDIDGISPSTAINTHSNEFHHVEDVLPVFVALMLLLAGIIQPNLLSSIYFLTFLVLGICWAFHFSSHIHKSYTYFCLKVLLLIYSGMQITLLYLYQMSFMQKLVYPQELVPRLLGIPAIVNATNCSRQRELIYNRDLTWPFYIYPFIIFILYWFLAVDNRLRRKKLSSSNSKVQKVTSPWWHPRAWSNAKSVRLLANRSSVSYGTVEHPVEPVMIQEEPEQPVHIQSTLSSMLMFLMRQSYIAALIIMMAWSIMYHSWLTFCFVILGLFNLDHSFCSLVLHGI